LDGVDSGVTLIEVMMAAAILATAAVALLIALTTVQASTRQGATNASLVAAMPSVVEAILDPTRNPFVPCAQPGDYDPTIGVDIESLGGVEVGDITVTEVLWWNGSSFDTDLGHCTGGARLQQVTVHFGSAEHNVDRSIEVIKRGD